MVMDLEMAPVTIPNVRMIVVIVMTVLTNPTCTVDPVLTHRKIEYSLKNKLNKIV